MVSGLVSIEYGLHGLICRLLQLVPVEITALDFQLGLFHTDDCDVMITGGSEMAITPLGLGGFSAVTALSTNNEILQS